MSPVNDIAPTRRCFHCGEPDHKVASCPISSGDGIRTNSGRHAFHRFLDAKQTISSRKKCNEKKKKDDNFHFVSVLEWMKEYQCNNIEAKDPYAVLEAAALAASNDGNVNKQRWNDLHKKKRNDLGKAHMEAFDTTINVVRNRLSNMLNVTPADEAKSNWHGELSRAVATGTPGDFSSASEESSGRCLNLYAVEKLKPRCRQLHHLLLHDNPFSARIRSLLLPSPEPGSTDVVSIGGGPGYDHVALCLVAKFLYDIQPSRNQMKMKNIRTQVFDLFDQDWKPVMSAVGKSFHETMGECIDGNSLSLSMHHSDLRQGLDSKMNDALELAIESANIIVLMFVLHENSSFIIEESDLEGKRQRRITGAIRDILSRSTLGTMLVCVDSANTLFPPLKETASEYGWSFLGDDESRKQSKKLPYFGPKSYVMLERIEIG